MPYLENALALVVGVNHYLHLPQLSKAANDASDIFRLLTDETVGGYKPDHARLLLNEDATHTAFVAELDRLAKQAKSDSTVIIFFAGHGAQAPGDGCFLLLHDTSPWHDGELNLQALEKTSLSNQDFSTALNRINCRQLTVIFDACHSGGFADPRNPFYNEVRLQRGLSEQFLVQLQSGEGRAIFASCRPGQSAWERVGDRNGVFTGALLDGLCGPAGENGVVRVFGLFDYLSKEVPVRAAQITDWMTGKPAIQEPYLKTALAQNYVVAQSPGSKAPSKAPVAEASAEESHDVFISYSHKDKRRVTRLVKRLREDGFLVWLDDEALGAGDPLPSALAGAIKRSAHVMLCVSENYLGSKWASFERGLAQTDDPANERRKVIPVKVGACKIPAEFQGLVFSDLTQGKNWESEYKKAIKNLGVPQVQRGMLHAPIANGSVRDASLEAPDSKAPRSETPKPPQPRPAFEINFDNRNDEIVLIGQQLMDRGSSPYMYIAEPAQAGKTFLLRELGHRYGGKSIEPLEDKSSNPGPLSWRAAYLDIGTNPSCVNDPEALVGAILTALGATPGHRVEEIGQYLNTGITV